MQGALEDVYLDEPFFATVETLNVAANNAKAFFISKDEDGKKVAISIRNITSLLESEREEEEYA